MKQKRKESRVTVVRYPHCAAIDVAKDLHAVALAPDENGEQEVKFFSGFTVALHAMGQWLKKNGVIQVAMESTGVYWIPAYEVLDALGFDMWLVNPAGLKRPDRRKSDVLDCQWLQQLMSLGLLSKSHRPPDEICELRGYVRDRQRTIQDRARCVQRMQKALQQMNVKLDSVLSDITGKSGMAIIEAIVAGEREARTLASLCDPRVKKSEDEIAAALLGNWRENHLFSLQQSLTTYHHYSSLLRQSEARILSLVDQLAARLTEQKDDSTGGGADRKPLKKPRRKWHQRLQMRLWELFEVDLTAIPGVGVETALTLLSELGHDFSEFDNAKKFSSWLGVAPGTNISGGKHLPGGAKGRSTQVAGQALRMSAMSLRRSQCPLGDRHRKRCSRMDPPRANKATAHELSRIIFAMVTKGEEYMERDQKTTAEQDCRRRLKWLQSEARRLGWDLVQSVDSDKTTQIQVVT